MITNDNANWQEDAPFKAMVEGLTFGSVIHSLRKCEGFSLTEMAKRLGVSAQRLCDYEKGRRTPELKTALAIGEVLGLAPSVLLKTLLEDMLKKENLAYNVKLEPKAG
jgi:transcriptional regulator with XRE-family HTH domain